MKNQSSVFRLIRRLSFRTTLAVIAFLVSPQFNGAVFAQEKSEQFLEPELEMAIIRQLNLEDRIANRQAVLPKNTKEQIGDEDVSGEWI